MVIMLRFNWYVMQVLHPLLNYQCSTITLSYTLKSVHILKGVVKEKYKVGAKQQTLQLIGTLLTKCATETRMA